MQVTGKSVDSTSERDEIKVENSVQLNILIKSHQFYVKASQMNID